jgi:hypothetical protein
MGYRFDLFLAVILAVVGIYWIRAGYQIIKIGKKTLYFPMNFFCLGIALDSIKKQNKRNISMLCLAAAIERLF